MGEEIETAKQEPAGLDSTQRKLIGDRGDHFLRKIEGETGANLSACYQCERCTNSCPVSSYMDVKPHQVIRYIQLGWRKQLLESSTIWVCLSCEMCTTYCPNEVRVAETMNHLRNLAFQSTAEPREKILAVFHETFVNELQRFGRVNEAWLIAALNRNPEVLKEKIRTGIIKEELKLGLALLKKGKLKFIPRRCREMKHIRAVCGKHPGGIL